jgi:hypothetical protein
MKTPTLKLLKFGKIFAEPFETEEINLTTIEGVSFAMVTDNETESEVTFEVVGTSESGIEHTFATKTATIGGGKFIRESLEAQSLASYELTHAKLRFTACNDENITGCVLAIFCGTERFSTEGEEKFVVVDTAFTEDEQATEPVA